MVENLKVALIWEQRLPSSFVSYNMDNEAVAAKEATQKQKTSRVMCHARSSLPTSVFAVQLQYARKRPDRETIIFEHTLTVRSRLFLF